MQTVIIASCFNSSQNNVIKTFLELSRSEKFEAIPQHTFFQKFDLESFIDKQAMLIFSSKTNYYKLHWHQFVFQSHDSKTF